MNANVKKWVDALRSGRFNQATGYLQRNGSYCCLGVACELAAEAGIIQPARIREGGIIHYADYEGRSADLPQAVQEWLGLADSDGTFDDDSLVDLNDTGYTFEEIADTIEREPEGLFA